MPEKTILIVPVTVEALKEPAVRLPPETSDRKSTRLNSSHDQISYAVFCLKKKNNRVRERDPRQDRGSRSNGVDRRVRARQNPPAVPHPGRALSTAPATPRSASAAVLASECEEMP